MMKRSALVLLLLTGVAMTTATLIQAPRYTFKDPKGVNSVAFTVDSLVEPIHGYFGGVDGNIEFNPDRPEATRGTLTVDAKSGRTFNERMAGALNQARWLDTENHPNITFKIIELSEVKKDNNVYRAMVDADLTIKGKTNRVSVPASLTFVPNGMETRSGGKGSLVVVRSTFEIKRSEFGMTEIPKEVVGENIELRISMAGVPMTSDSSARE